MNAEKTSRLIRESSIYVAIGALLSGMGFLFYALLFLMLSEWVSYLLLYFFSYSIMLCLSYLTYARAVFKSKPSFRGFVKYFLATQLNTWITFAILPIAVEVFLIDPLYAPILPMLIMTPIMFFLSKRHIFVRVGVKQS